MSNPTQLGLLILVFVTGCSRSLTADKAEMRHVFKVGAAGVPVDSADLAAVRTVVAERLKASSLSAGFIVETNGTDELLVLTPDISDAQLAAVQDLATRPGTLEFALLANTRDHAALIEGADGAASAILVGEERQTAWIPLKQDNNGQPIDLSDDGSIVSRAVTHEGQTEKQVLVVLNAPKLRLTDTYLKTAYPEVNPIGLPVFGFEFNTQGAFMMQRMTAAALPDPDGFKRRLGIIVDGRLHSAPSINDLVGARAIIEGDFTQEDVDRMVHIFNAGRLPLPVRFVESQDVDSESPDFD